MSTSNDSRDATAMAPATAHEDVSSILAAVDFEKAKLHPMANLGQIDYLFNSDDDMGMALPERSYFDHMWYGVGTTYIAGLGIGGAWGFMEGLRGTRHLPPSFKVRLNGVLNGCTRRGPYVGNSMGILAFFYCTANGTISKMRGKQDSLSSILAGGLSGALFRSTAGLRSAGIAGLVGASLAAVWHTSQNAVISLPMLSSRSEQHA